MLEYPQRKTANHRFPAHLYCLQQGHNHLTLVCHNQQFLLQCIFQFPLFLLCSSDKYNHYCRIHPVVENPPHLWQKYPLPFVLLLVSVPASHSYHFRSIQSQPRNIQYGTLLLSKYLALHNYPYQKRTEMSLLS